MTEEEITSLEKEYTYSKDEEFGLTAIEYIDFEKMVEHYPPTIRCMFYCMILAP